MAKKLFLGDDAIAQGALDAGLSGVYSYPGTPSTEITEYIQHATKGSIPCRWATNEKTAMEAALGMSYAGKRALVCMKHVGMNVAADAFVNSAMTGANGGLMVVAADDPSMHSSQNEQDSRFYGAFAYIPMLEPSNQQECYDMTRYAYDFSEKMGIPVLMRLTTRLAHSRSAVNLSAVREQNKMSVPGDDKRAQWMLMPANSRRRYDALLAQWPEFIKASEESPYNKYVDAQDKSMGIIACGIAYNYLMENYPDGKCPYPVLKISQYPLPVSLIQRMINECKTIMVMEEGQPMVEERIKGMMEGSQRVKGRLSGALPRTGELNPDSVRLALGLPKLETFDRSELVVARPPALCAGCGHRDVYEALNQVLAEYPESRVFSDIGCYTLGALPPFRAIDTVVDMGASITMARGAAESGLYPAVAVIGDSTFTHSGMTGLLDAVNTNANITVIISDNLTTAMTGGQDSAGTNRLHKICEGLGVAPEHIRSFVPMGKNMEQMKGIIREEIEHKGISVIIPCRECLQTLKRHLKEAKKNK